MLDKDSATRTANLSQIFKELGFSQAARIEAIKAINTDYTNYSAHRLLADSYTSLLTTKASLSESRTALLLSPLSFNVYNNTSAESSLYEYSALFDKNEHRTGLNISGMTYDDLFTGDIIQAGKVDMFGYMLEAFNASKNGSKKNNFDRTNRVTTAFQYELDPDHRLVFDGSYTYLSDRTFAISDTPETDRNDASDAALGYHGKFEDNQHILAQIAYTLDNQRARQYDYRDILTSFSSSLEKTRLIDDGALEKLHNHDEVNQVQGSIEHIFDSDIVTTTLGYEHIYTGVNRKENARILYDEMDVYSNLAKSLRSKADYNLNSNNVHLYTTGHLMDVADLTFGVGYISQNFEKVTGETLLDDTFRVNKPTWKTGLTLYPISDLTIRSAYFRGIASSATENLRTLEPTLVGGINQFYLDNPGTESENYGIGIDYKIPSKSYFGVEYLRRNLTSRAASATAMIDFDFESAREIHDILAEDFKEFRDQDFLNAYWYQVLSQDWTAAFDYSYSKEHLDVDFKQELQRHTLGMGLKHFLCNNIFAYGRGVWHQQDREGSAFYADGVTDFWTLDFGLGYRVPERHGVIMLELLNVLDEKFDLDQSLGFYEFIPEGIGGRITASVNF